MIGSKKRGDANSFQRTPLDGQKIEKSGDMKMTKIALTIAAVLAATGIS
ncbi:hypothetical protein [Mesorhizobium sp. ORS 3428]|nr:hypothetical protein [Mesorhizobium sp. ORS 3428]